MCLRPPDVPASAMPPTAYCLFLCLPSCIFLIVSSVRPATAENLNDTSNFYELFVQEIDALSSLDTQTPSYSFRELLADLQSRAANATKLVVKRLLAKTIRSAKITLISTFVQLFVQVAQMMRLDSSLLMDNYRLLDADQVSLDQLLDKMVVKITEWLKEIFS